MTYFYPKYHIFVYCGRKSINIAYISEYSEEIRQVKSFLILSLELLIIHVEAKLWHLWNNIKHMKIKDQSDISGLNQ